MHTIASLDMDARGLLGVRDGPGTRGSSCTLAPSSYPSVLKPEPWASSAHLHTLSLPQSLPRCHTVSRERLTIIPHGVPHMTKLLRYFVSEDSIFLHLEHVQGEGALWGAPINSNKLWGIAVLPHPDKICGAVRRDAACSR